MKTFFLFLFCSQFVWAVPTRHELTGEEKGIYYLDWPNGEGQFPLLLLIDGSYSDKAGPMSVLWLEEKFAQALLPMNWGVVAMEKCGVDGDQLDAELFHRHNTPSHRLANQLRLIQELREHPPKNWNGQLAILGGSEGGPIAIKTAEAVSADACVVLVGCGDQTFKEYIWSCLQTLPEEVRCELLPATDGSIEAYEAQVEKMKANPDPFCFWFGQSYLYWADALDGREDQAFLKLKCPILVVTGSEDVECPSTDRLIGLAKNLKVTYLRVEGMGHAVLDPRWKVIEQVQQFLNLNSL